MCMTKCFAGDTQTVSSETAMVFTDSPKSKSLFVRLRALFHDLFCVGYGTLNGLFLQRDFGTLDDIFLFWVLCLLCYHLHVLQGHHSVQEGSLVLLQFVLIFLDDGR